MADKAQGLSGMSGRQKGIAVIFVVIVIIILWQVYGLLQSSNNPASTTVANKNATVTGTTTGTGPNGANQMPTPTPTQLPVANPDTAAMTPRELELMKLQQETQAKYIGALNELQMLKVAREIAETNQAIMAARFDTVKSEKSIVDMLSTPAPQAVSPQTYAQNMANSAPKPSTPQAPVVNYTVISVSQLQYRWSAVIGSQGNLYNVVVGDVLPSDGSKVISISKSGVVLENHGISTTISLVPII